MQFKTLALATASLVALGLAVTPASAKSGMTGNMSLGTGITIQDDDDGGENVNNDIGDIDDQFWNIFGGAKVNHAYNENVNVQVDITGDAAYANEDNDDNFGTTFGIVGHLNYSDDSGFLGVFGATGRTSSIEEPGTASYFAAGFEGEFTGANWTAGGQIGWLDSCCDASSSFEFLQQAGFVRIDGAFYPNPDIRIGAGGAYIDGTRDTSFPELDVTMWEWTVAAEKMIGRNTSVVLEYRGLLAEESDSTENDYDSHSVNLAFVFHFNATNVYASHVDGASAQTLRFGRWVSEGGPQLD